jgi:uncharacterized phiE125 gp8 family phage protein
VLSLDEARLHLRVDNDDEDDAILAWIETAVDDIESVTGRAIAPQTLKLSLDSFTEHARDGTIYLPRPIVQFVTSVKYVDIDGVLQTLVAGTDYVTALADEIAPRVLPAHGKTWPTAIAMPESVQIVYVAGYLNAGAVPSKIKSFVKLMLTTMYENRSTVTVGRIVTENEFAQRLLDSYRVDWVG